LIEREKLEKSESKYAKGPWGVVRRRCFVCEKLKGNFGGRRSFRHWRAHCMRIRRWLRMLAGFWTGVFVLGMLVARRSLLLREAVRDALGAGSNHRQHEDDRRKLPHLFSVAG
jgi:hypothetical protein